MEDFLRLPVLPVEEVRVREGLEDRLLRVSLGGGCWRSALAESCDID